MSIFELDAQAKAYFELQAQIEELQAMQESIKDLIKANMVEIEQEEITGHGWRATWHNTTTNRFDTTAFKKANPALYAEYTKPSNSTRFTLNTIKA